MRIQIQGLQEINGPLVVLSHVPNVGFDELVQLQLESGEIRTGRVVEAGRDRCVVQVFEGTNGVSLQNTTATMLGHPLELPLSPEILGRVFNGAGAPVDGLGAGFCRKNDWISTACR